MFGTITLPRGPKTHQGLALFLCFLYYSTSNCTLDKLGFRHLYNCHQMELIETCTAFDIASLILFGTQAIPIRLKIVLDRIFSVLQHDEVLRVLQCFGWTYEDYVRGYIVQDVTGNVLETWTLATQEEEQLILQQFLRFGETKRIANHLLFLEHHNKPDEILKAESNIRRFIERTNRVARIDLANEEMANELVRADIESEEMANKVAREDTIEQQQELSNLSTAPPSCHPSYREPLSSWSTRCQPSSTVSPLNYASHLPLNKLQPYDLRKQKSSQELHYSSSVLCPSRITSVSDAQSFNSCVTTAQSDYTNTTTIINSYFNITDGGPDENNKITMNKSQIGTYISNSSYTSKKAKNLRKTNNPVKKCWYPLELRILNSKQPTGKKRVQCLGCFKTFCDKGALKIHFSAVHLREMHKCTVEGCHMMFSSRRSRNRHSANPNPKLHIPTFKRKINPHDGRIANPYPALPSSVKVMKNDMSLSFGSGVEPDRDSMDFGNYSQLPFDNDITKDVSISFEPLKSTSEQTGNSFHAKNHSSEENVHQTNPSSKSTNLFTKLNSSTNNRGVRKRKSFKPTKCAVTSSNEIQYLPTGETSSDTFMNQGEENDVIDLFEDDCSKVCEDLKLMIEVKEEKSFEEEPLVSNKQDKSGTPLHYLENFSMNVYSGKVKTPVQSLMSNHLSRSTGNAFHAPDLGVSEDACGTNKDDTSSPQGLSSTDQNSNPSNDQNFSLTVDSGIPMDKENPRRCVTCGKVFQNHFGVKIHYQNVHLKLMHQCTMGGCNASFPSKRSRDRHSANLTLHKKLLSTNSGVLEITSRYPYQVGALRDDLISRLYDPEAYVDFYQGRIRTCRPKGVGADTMFTRHLGSLDPLSHALPLNPVLLPSISTSSLPEWVTGRIDINIGESPFISPSGRHTNTTPPKENQINRCAPEITPPKKNQINRCRPVTSDEILLTKSEGQYTCKFCETKLEEGEQMKSHYETLHVEELLCSGVGCDKAYLTKGPWNFHSHQDRGPSVTQTTISSVT
ncbi:zinc finger protein basonuclin-2-like [Tachypleus tridentatus]|uniref:zinc finger protein basonuclin-2-like n=1 Tax=Tachypleus tridentatus TaxID=6853 RepID=UPI003FD19802